MKKLFTMLFSLIVLTNCTSPEAPESHIVTSDIDLFWEAYDQITSTTDSVEQLKLFNELFIEKGSAGLQRMIDAKRYTVTEYLDAINDYPKFWADMRENTFKAKALATQLDGGVEKLRAIYPTLKPAKIYFTIGALRSNGTTQDSCVLIGAELALATPQTPTEEFDEERPHLKGFFKSNPSQGLVFLNTHEYVHTQQKTTIGNTLLAQTVIEGVAEFTAEKALNTPSPNPQIAFGQANDQRIKEKFVIEMFSPYLYNWIWNSPKNEFNMRDLAYYVGYMIASNYYEQAGNKAEALKTMIELDYNNEEELIAFVDKSGYFDVPVQQYKEAFEKNQPQVTQLEGFENGTQVLSPTTSKVVIHFSQAMNTTRRNFKYGPLGEQHVLPIDGLPSFSNDGKSLTITFNTLTPNMSYDLIIGEGFQNMDGLPLKPYLIAVKTAAK